MLSKKLFSPRELSGGCSEKIGVDSFYVKPLR